MVLHCPASIYLLKWIFKFVAKHLLHSMPLVYGKFLLKYSYHITSIAVKIQKKLTFAGNYIE
jgi:hypothetical protein